MARTYVFRLTAEGVRELERDFKSLGETGERAFADLAKRVPGLGGALSDANRRLDEHRERISNTETSIGRLIGRYTAWGAVIAGTRALIRTAVEHNNEAAASVDRISEQYERFAKAVAPAVATGLGLIATAAEKTGDAFARMNAEGQKAVAELMRRQGGVAPLTAQQGGPGAMLLSNRLPTVGVTPSQVGGVDWYTKYVADQLTAESKAREDAQKKADDDAKKELDEKLRRIQQEFEWWEKFYADKRALADKARADEKSAEEKNNKAIHDQIIALSQQGFKIEQENADKRQDQYDEDDRKAKERLDRIHGYWVDTLDAMTNDGSRFFENLFETGEGNLGDFIDVFKRAWARLFADLATQQFVQPLMRSFLAQMGPLVGQVAGGGAPAGLLGGGGGLLGGLGGLGGIGAALGLGGAGYYNTAAGLIPAGVTVTPAVGLGGFSFGGALSGGLGGAGIGSITGMIGGNTTGGAIGGGIGGVIGAGLGSIIPGVGTALGGLIGGALGGVVGGLFGGKPSNYRATATFGPGGGFTLSGDKPNEQTLSLAQQAASAIMQEVTDLKAFGVEFQRQLSNIWIGQRDPSSYQLVGGQRISVGTVGNAGDLAQQTLAALMKGATSTDPIVAQQLARGYGSIQELTQAITFAKGIEASLKQITDPLGAAIDLWKKEAQARLDMAAATGVSIEKVQQLNAALYGQIVNQANQGVVNNIGGYLSQLQYGPESIAPPGQQYAAALADYEKSRAAAMGGGAAEAQAYLEATQQFLPFAREYLGTTQAYAAIEGTARTTLESLASKLSAPAQMPDLVIPIVNATTTTGAATVDAVEGVRNEVKALGDRLDRLSGGIESLLRSTVTA